MSHTINGIGALSVLIPSFFKDDTTATIIQLSGDI
jgi:hypothetical protein